MKKLQAVLLCALVLAVLAAADLGYNFFASLVPEINDGISVRGVLAPLLFSDHLLGDFWSRERFLNAFVAAAYAVGALAAANVVCRRPYHARKNNGGGRVRRFCAFLLWWPENAV